MADLPKEPKASEITSRAQYQSRREWLARAGLFGATSLLWGSGLIALSSRGSADPPAAPPTLPPPPPGEEPVVWRVNKPSPFDTTEEQNSFQDITTFNNFYELGLSKSAPARNAGSLKPRPWTLVVEGEVHKPQTIDIDSLLRAFPLEQRIYRMRCVEAWSMVIPWVGFPLAALLKRVEPTSHAKYVVFETLLDTKQLPGQRDSVLKWPYVEGLRIDEANNPLTLMAVGLYDAPLPGQNGAPLRLVVPWKYGFKGIKSIVKMRLVKVQPRTTWAIAAPSEYGFYANVNPTVDHPRWSQASERRIGKLGRIDTQMFNGYGEQVAHLYRGMDLRKKF